MADSSNAGHALCGSRLMLQYMATNDGTQLKSQITDASAIKPPNVITRLYQRVQVLNIIELPNIYIALGHG